VNVCPFIFTLSPFFKLEFKNKIRILIVM